MKSFALLLIAALSVSHYAYAGAEIRASYGLQFGKPTEFNSAMNAKYTNSPPIDSETAISADAVYVTMSKRIELGLRYENFSFSKDGTVIISNANIDAKTKLTGSRISLLAGYRFVDTAALRVSGLVTIGASQSFTYEQKQTYGPTTNTYTWEPEMSTSFGAGVQGALRLGMAAVLGLEAGYLSMNGKIRQDNAGVLVNNSGTDVKFDLSGPYAKGFIGYGF